MEANESKRIIRAASELFEKLSFKRSIKSPFRALAYFYFRDNRIYIEHGAGTGRMENDE